MSTSRKRNFIATAGRLTAVTLSVALLAGCTGARFMMGGDPAPVNPTGVQPAPVTPTTPAQPAQFITVTGKASLLGVPMANATVKVFDALTNAPAAVIAAGGGNVIAAGGANYDVQQASGRPPLQVGAQSITTDNQGNFSLPLGNFRPGMAARIVVTVGGKTLTTLVSGTGKALGDTAAKQYTVATVVFNDAGLFEIQNIKVDEVSHAQTQVLWAYNLLGGVLDVSKSSSFVDAGFDQVNGWALPYIEAAKKAEFLDCDDAGRPVDLATLGTFTKETGLDNQINTLVTNGQKTIAQQVAQDPSSVLGTVNLTANDLAGSDLKASVTNGQFTLTNEKTGETTTVSMPTAGDSGGQTGGETPTTNTSSSGGSSGPDPNVTPVITNANTFNPTVTVTYTAGTPGVLSVSVSQPSGTEDIGAVYARLPKDKVTLGTLGATLHAAGSQVDPDGAGPMAPGALTITQDSGAASSVALPTRFSSATLSNPLWSGYIKNGTTNVATFQVFEYGAYYYLVTSYRLSSAVVTNGGHATTLTTNAVSTLTAGSTLVEITLESRSNNKVDRAITL